MGFLSELAKEMARAPEMDELRAFHEVRSQLDRMCPKCRAAAIKAALRMGGARAGKCESEFHPR